MFSLGKSVAWGGAVALGLPLALLSADTSSRAADHFDPPTRTDPLVDPNPDVGADIADIYAWHTAEHLVITFNFGGPSVTTLPAFYDRDVVFTLNISNAGARTDAEFPIEIRFGRNGTVNGVRLTNVPGAASNPVIGPVETDIVTGGTMIRAGLFDDPFFFDAQGLRETRSSGTLMIRNDRNVFGGRNITSVVFQIPRSAIQNGTHPIDIWATSARFGGQI